MRIHNILNRNKLYGKKKNVSARKRFLSIFENMQPA